MTLTEISYYSRKYAPYLILAFLVFLIFIYAIRLLFILIQTKQDTSIPTNTVFGKINKPKIPNATSSTGINFSLDTVEGEPITATQAAKVIFLPAPQTIFGFSDKIYLTAKAVGFDTSVVKHKLIGTSAIFQDSNKTLTIDISNFNFEYQYSFENEPSIFVTAIRPGQDESEESAINFLKAIDRYPSELAQSKTNVTFLKYSPDTKTITTLSNNVGSNMVEVDFYRPDIDGFPAVSPKYFTSQNYVLLLTNDNGAKILRSQVKFFERSDDQVGIYPLKSGKQAYSDLKKGKGFIVSNPNNLKDVTIKKMFLGYYDPETYQDYLEPVYVFLGGSEDDKFVAYVPAVSDEFVAD